MEDSILVGTPMSNRQKVSQNHDSEEVDHITYK